MNDLTLGQKIRNFRKRAGMSQLGLELAIGASPGSISRIENGKVNPTKETLLEIAKTLRLEHIETSSIFGIETTDFFRGFSRAIKNINSQSDLKGILQAAVNEIAKELNVLSGFISIRKGDKLYSYVATENWMSKFVYRVIPTQFSNLSVDLIKDQKNKIVESYNKQDFVEGEDLVEFIYPAVSKQMAKLLTKVIGNPMCCAMPITYGDRKYRVLMVGKRTNESFEGYKEVLIDFVEHVALGIGKLSLSDHMLANKYENNNK